MPDLQLLIKDYSSPSKQVNFHIIHIEIFVMLTQLSYCNTINSISRCTRFRFGPLNPIQILPRLKYVADKEDVKMTEDGEKALITLAQGDMRKVRIKRHHCFIKICPQ